MSLDISLQAVLLAAVASPLRRCLSWYRTDAPVPISIDDRHVHAMQDRGLLRYQAPARRGGVHLMVATLAGVEEAEALWELLGDERRELLRRIGDAGELVRRERRSRVEEQCAALGRGDLPTERLVEWVAPRRTAPALGYPTEICLDGALQDLVVRGLVVLLAGGTRAVLTGAGRWCADRAPSSDSDASGDQDATGVATEPETAPATPQRLSNWVSR